MQAVCDSNGRFLSVEIKYPGSTSDFFAFEQSKLKSILEREGFLRPGLCLFGDNAYVNTPYMCVPFRNITACSTEEEFKRKDGFNFSSLRSELILSVHLAFLSIALECSENQFQSISRSRKHAV